MYLKYGINVLYFYEFYLDSLNHGLYEMPLSAYFYWNFICYVIFIIIIIILFPGIRSEHH